MEPRGGCSVSKDLEARRILQALCQTSQPPVKLQHAVSRPHNPGETAGLMACLRGISVKADDCYG